MSAVISIDDVQAGGGLPNISEPSVLNVVFHNFDPPCRRERGNRDYTTEPEECEPSQRVAELFRVSFVDLASNCSNGLLVTMNFIPLVRTFLIVYPDSDA